MRYGSVIGLESDVWSLGALYYYLVFGEKRKIKVNVDSVSFDVPA